MDDTTSQPRPDNPTVADWLRELRAKRVLILKAEWEPDMEPKCMMEECACPEEMGGRFYFEKVTGDRFVHSPWQPSPDHFPILNSQGGSLTPSNVRLVHYRCNCIQGSRIGSSIGGKIGAPRALKITHDEAHRADPNYLLNRSKAGKIGGVVTNSPERRNDPEYIAAQSRRGQTRHDEAHRADPKYQEFLSRNGSITSAMRRECADCDMVSTPPAMGTHFKHSGHNPGVLIVPDEMTTK